MLAESGLGQIPDLQTIARDRLLPKPKQNPTRRDDSLFPGADHLAVGVHHGAFGLDIADDLPMIVADLQVARGPDCRCSRGAGDTCS